MELLVDIRTGSSTARTDTKTVTCLLITLSLLALVMSFAVFAIEPAYVPDTPYLGDFLYVIASKCILHLTFLAKLVFISTIYISAITLEPVLLSAWEQSSRILIVVWTFLLRNLWTLVCRICKLCIAFLTGPVHPPDEPTGLRSFAAHDESPRFIHCWLAGTSPHLVYH